MDSTSETNDHIRHFQDFLFKIICELDRRYVLHDQSKLEEPEKSGFDQVTKKLHGITYGSEEYQQCLQEMKPFLDHHYANNSHHPEHTKDGIKGMSLVDIIEMLCDWKAATLRHHDGDIKRSIEINQKRFGYSDELKQIFLNTIPIFDMD
jgi:hypothetical protein